MPQRKGWQVLSVARAISKWSSPAIAAKRFSRFADRKRGQPANAETFVARLVRSGAISYDSAVHAALEGEPDVLSRRSRQRHFLQATGVYPESVIVVIGVIELVCLVLYATPRTAVLGAILSTGYLGGAIATHVRINSPLFTHTLFPIYVAALIWGGIFLREHRLRALVPLRR